MKQDSISSLNGIVFQTNRFKKVQIVALLEARVIGHAIKRIEPHDTFRIAFDVRIRFYSACLAINRADFAEFDQAFGRVN